MLPLIRIELFKIFSKWRTYISFGAIAFLVSMVHLAMYLEGEKTLNHMTQSLQSIFLFSGNLVNGYLASHFILGALIIHIPFLITLVTGDLLAGEATAGTYRMLLTRPVSRLQVVSAKFIAGCIYTLIVIIWLALLSLGLGVLFFGKGELLVTGSEITILAQNDILWRFALAYGFAALSMATVAALSFMMSSLVENSIGPIVGTMAIIIVFLIMANLDFGFFSSIRPWLFTHYMPTWRSFFESPIDTEEVLKAVAVLAAHVIGLFGITAYIFTRKDILS